MASSSSSPPDTGPRQDNSSSRSLHATQQLLRQHSNPQKGTQNGDHAPSGARARTQPFTTPRLSSESPGYENKLFSKRAREIQAEEGLPLPIWSSPSGTMRELAFSNGTELRASAPQTPLSGGNRSRHNSSSSPTEGSAGSRRNRAGTLPSTFNSREPGESGQIDVSRDGEGLSRSTESGNRNRSGSLNLPAGRQTYSTAFGPSIFSTSWSNRVSGIPSSPISHSQFSKDDEQTPVRTLDYLGLADTPNSTSSGGRDPILSASMRPFTADVSQLRQDVNRIRSYSVNATEKYDDEYEDDFDSQADISYASGQESNVSVRRPRARTTANITNSPPPSIGIPRYESPSNIDSRGTYMEEIRPHSSDVALSNSLDDASIGPTRALWLGNIPASTTSSSLIAIFGPYGAIESARVLTQKNCGFVNFEIIESAVQARAFLHGKELFPGAGPIRIGFAKVPTAPVLKAVASPEPFGHGIDDLGSRSPRRKAVDEIPEMLRICGELGASPAEVEEVEASAKEAASYDEYAQEIPSIPEASVSRLYDAPRLRDLRKRIDNGSCSGDEIEQTAVEMLEEVAELSSDYLGNTVVQKLFEYCSEETKEMLLERIAPHIAEIGVHKNGTWAAQKIIEVARTEKQMNMIVTNLRPYTPLLFLDQYGNYVLQCCLRFGSPWNDFVFKTMLRNLSDLSYGRFGSRAMRACLESHYTSRTQQEMLAAAIAIHSVELATNANSALLLTWYLDSCVFPSRHRALAPILIPQLASLCTHKLASLTILKIVNQRVETDARQQILQALFFSSKDKLLEDILSDSSNGPSFIFKTLTTPHIDGELRQKITSNIRKVLVHLKAGPSQSFKRLMDEIGLSTRNTSVAGSSPRSEEGARRPSRDYQPQFYSVPPQPNYDPLGHSSVDASMLQSLNALGRGGGASAYPGGLANGNPYVNSQSFAAQQNIQYQAMLQQQLRNTAVAGGPQQSFYRFQHPVQGQVANPFLSSDEGQQGNMDPFFAQQLLQAGYPVMNGVMYPPQQQQGERKVRQLHGTC